MAKNSRENLGDALLKEARELEIQRPWEHRLVTFAWSVEEDPNVVRLLDDHKDVGPNGYAGIMNGDVRPVYNALAALAYISGPPGEEDTQILGAAVDALLYRRFKSEWATLQRKLKGERVQELDAVKLARLDLPAHAQSIDRQYWAALEAGLNHVWGSNEVEELIDRISGDNVEGYHPTVGIPDADEPGLQEEDILVQFLRHVPHSEGDTSNLPILAYVVHQLMGMPSRGLDFNSSVGKQAADVVLGPLYARALESSVRSGVLSSRDYTSGKKVIAPRSGVF